MKSTSSDFDQIYAEFQPAVYRYLSQLVGEKAAEDLTQEVFIKVGNGLSSFNNQSKLSTWIFQIATNAATDKLRSRAFKQLSLEEPQGELAECASVSSISVEDTLVRKEMNKCIRAYINLLPDTYRIVLVLSELEGFRDGEIAAIQGISLGTVKIRLHRARQKLKDFLAKNCILYKTDCNTLACEPKGTIPNGIKPLTPKKH